MGSSKASCPSSRAPGNPVNVSTLCAALKHRMWTKLHNGMSGAGRDPLKQETDLSIICSIGGKTIIQSGMVCVAGRVGLAAGWAKFSPPRNPQLTAAGLCWPGVCNAHCCPMCEAVATICVARPLWSVIYALWSHFPHSQHIECSRVLHTLSSALIVSLPLKRVGLTCAGQVGHMSANKARWGPADDILAMEHKIEEALPCWSKNRRQITGAGKRRAQKAGGRRAKTLDQVTGGVRLADIYWLEAACRVFATVSWKRVLAADANGGNSCLLKSHSAKPLSCQQWNLSVRTINESFSSLSQHHLPSPFPKALINH